MADSAGPTSTAEQLTIVVTAGAHIECCAYVVCTSSCSENVAAATLEACFLRQKPQEHTDEQLLQQTVC
jgi:hypothetical protein